ncbi:hypothetical protein NXC24_PC00454 (plasmid) [Rhizobium sp. NXC24]|nr:hypothetical protein NXC24_PC00454 [Rhizobium sp. NXC24]
MFLISCISLERVFSSEPAQASPWWHIALGMRRRLPLWRGSWLSPISSLRLRPLCSSQSPVSRSRGRRVTRFGRSGSSGRSSSISLQVAFWPAVVWMQIEMRNIASKAIAAGEPLTRRYHRLFWTWFYFGFPAFAAVLGIICLMITQPAWDSTKPRRSERCGLA